jgi:PAS domain S-box-containing protein
MLPRSKSLVLLALIFSVGVLLVAGTFAHSALRLLTEAREQSRQSRDTQLELEAAVSSLLDAETGQRGYLLTGKPEYLAPYNEALRDLNAHLAALAALTGDSAEQHREFLALQQASEAKLAELAQTIRLDRAGDHGAALAIVMTDAGKKSMDQVRLIAERMGRTESAAYLQSDQRERFAKRLTLLGAWATALLAISLLGLLYLVVRRDARELRASEMKLAITLHSIGDAVIATDAAGRIELMNPVAESLTGWPITAARGRALDDVFRIINEYTRAVVESPVTKVLRAGVVVGLANHTLLIRRDGVETPIADSGAPILSESNQTVGVVLVFRDASPERDLERAMHEADRRKDEFLATLSHELRNPLAPIRQAVAVIRAPAATAAQTRWSVEVIDRQVHNMARLLDDLLDVSRITRGTLEVRPAHVSLGSVLEAAIELARPVIDGKHHLFTADYPADIVLYADPLRLAQVVGNLLTNAAKYTDAHGQIALRAWKDGQEVVITVKDSGVGLPGEMLSRVFEMFVQADGARARSEGGLGIGLALAKGLVELHGGRIEARSDGPGRGSEFVVRLPAAHAGSQATPAGERARPAAPTRPARFLVADDNTDAADSLAMLLRLEGHQVEVATDGAMALKMLELSPPDFALLDVGMPKVNGHQVASQVRAAAWGQSTILVALTGWGQESDREKALAAGFHHHFVKPVELDDLLRVIHSAGKAGDSAGRFG